MKVFVATTLVVVLSNITVPSLYSQTAPVFSSADKTRQRMEAAIERQKKAVASMRDGSLRTMGAADRSQPAPASGFFTLPPLLPSTVPAAFAVCEPLPPAEIDALANSASASTSVDPRLITAVMKEESGNRPCAVSSKGAMGLMQLLPETAGELGLVNPFGARENVLAGAKLLRQLMDHYNGDLALVLSAYNAGPGAVDAAKTVPHFTETVNYVRDILSRLSPLSPLIGVISNAPQSDTCELPEDGLGSEDSVDSGNCGQPSVPGE